MLQESFGKIKKFWLDVPEDIKRDYWSKISIALVANKCDSEGMHAIELETEAQNFARNFGWQYYVASAVKNTNTNNVLGAFIMHTPKVVWK